MNGRFQMQGGKNWILPKEMNANRFFWNSHWLKIWSNHQFPSMGPKGGIVAMDSGIYLGLAAVGRWCLGWAGGMGMLRLVRLGWAGGMGMLRLVRLGGSWGRGRRSRSDTCSHRKRITLRTIHRPMRIKSDLPNAYELAVLRIWIRMFLGLLDSDQLVRHMETDHHIRIQIGNLLSSSKYSKKNLHSYCFATSL
jgi:hypothetical protein